MGEETIYLKERQASLEKDVENGMNWQDELSSLCNELDDKNKSINQELEKSLEQIEKFKKENAILTMDVNDGLQRQGMPNSKYEANCERLKSTQFDLEECRERNQKIVEEKMLLQADVEAGMHRQVVLTSKCNELSGKVELRNREWADLHKQNLLLKDEIKVKNDSVLDMLKELKDIQLEKFDLNSTITKLRNEVSIKENYI